MLTFHICHLDNFSQGYEEQYSQWRRPIGNTGIYKRHITHFCASADRFREINIKQINDLENVGQGQCTTFLMAPFNGRYVTATCALFVTVYEIFAIQIKCQTSNFEKWRSRSRGKNGTCAIQLAMSDFTWVIFVSECYQSSNIYVYANLATHFHTHFYVHTLVETAGDVGNG